MTPCTRITPNTLKENYNRSYQAYRLSLPFENLVDQAKDEVDFALTGKYPCKDKQIATSGHNLTHETDDRDVCYKHLRAF